MLMTIREVAATGIMPEHALRILVKTDAIPGVVFIGKKALIPYPLLEAWLNTPNIKRINAEKGAK